MSSSNGILSDSREEQYSPLQFSDMYLYAEMNKEVANIIPQNVTYETTPNILRILSEVCSMARSDVVSLIADARRTSTSFLRNFCDITEVTFVSLRNHPQDDEDEFSSIHPTTSSLAELYHRVMQIKGWKSLTILYEKTNELISWKETLTKWNNMDYPVSFQRIGSLKDNRNTLYKLKDLYSKNIVIACSYNMLESILHSSLQTGLMSHETQFFITSPDLRHLDLDPFHYVGTNITGLRPLDLPRSLEQDECHGEPCNRDEAVHDIFFKQVLLRNAIDHCSSAYPNWDKLMWSACDQFGTARDVAKFRTTLGWVREEASPTNILIQDTGFPNDIRYEIIEISRGRQEKKGNWIAGKGLKWILESSSSPGNESMSLQNTTFRVLIALTKPYGMLRETVFRMSGNEQYEGFAVDIIHEISKILGFNYTFTVQTDNVYGSLNHETGQWNGMLRKIIDDEADLAITDLTITAERETAVDFTMPFMNLGISILYQKPTAAPPSLMSFLLPFSVDVWLNLIVVYVIVSILFFIIGRMCPAEWVNVYPCIEEPEELENQFTIKNSLWFCMGAIMQQGSEIAPIGNSTRMLAGCWWFFCLIIVSSYTANLAAFLTVETVERPIKNAEDLANQGEIKYGAKSGGSTLSFFKDSNSSTYSKMYRYMMENALDVLTSDNDQGKKKVLEENYAFLMESSSIEYIQERECNLTQIGGLLDQKGYGIAMKKNSSFRNEMSGAVLKLQEMGVLAALKNKWWKEKGGGGRCEEETGGSQAGELGLANVGGVFLVLVVGATLSFIITLLECLLALRSSNSQTNERYLDLMNVEIEFIDRFRGVTRQN